jgi:hypothetical protein
MTGVSPYFAHRVAYALANDLDPETLGGVVRHTCDNPPCCNPAHLVLGTARENVEDARARRRAWWQHGVRDRDAGGRLNSNPLRRDRVIENDCKRLRRYCRNAVEVANVTPLPVRGRAAVVGDLGPFVMAKIAAQVEAEWLARSLRNWIEAQR